jgi:hypothetical protein
MPTALLAAKKFEQLFDVGEQHPLGAKNLPG